MLSRVKIQNFKSIGEPGVDLELKPLTFLVGPNGGGKSSILEAIGVTAQQDIAGRLVAFQTREQVVHGGDHTPRTAAINVWFDDVAGWQILVSNQAIKPTPLWGGAPPSTSNQATELNRLAGGLLSRSFLVSSVRGDVPYTSDTGTYPEWVGSHGESLLPSLARLFGQRRHAETAATIAKWAKRFGVDGLKAGIWGSNIAGSDYVDGELKVALNLALSSSGARQILTIITQLFWAPEGSLLMIEEPEISLHPKAQIAVLEMFAEAIKDDKQIMATTHSLFMMQALGYAVHKGWLDHDDIGVYHIEKKKSVGTVAKRLKVKKTGYIEGWIPSFNKVERDLLREWAKTLPRAR